MSLRIEGVENVDQLAATNEKPNSEKIKQTPTTKSDEQVKMNKVANKRRLFNRKTGV